MLFRHTGIYLIARLLPGSLNLVAIYFYTRWLTPEEYGRYALVVAGVGLANVLSFQWLRLSLLRFLAPLSGDAAPLLSTVLAVFRYIAVVVGLAGAVLAILWQSVTLKPLILLAIPLLWAQAWFELNLEVARGRLAPLQYGEANGIRAILCVGVGILAVFVGFGVYGPLVGLLIGSSVVGLYYGRANWHGIKIGRSLSHIKPLLAYGWPLATTGGLTFLINASDRLLIVGFLGESEAGPYSVGFDLAQQSMVAAFMTINLAATPLFFTAYEREGFDAAKRQFIKNGQLFFGVGVPATIALYTFQDAIIQFLIGAEYRAQASKIFSYVLLASFIQCIKAYYVDPIFYLAKKTILHMWTVVPAAVLTLVLNIVLIPRAGIIGASYTFLISSVVALCTAIVLAKWAVKALK